jgi:hypothetical protein
MLHSPIAIPGLIRTSVALVFSNLVSATIILCSCVSLLAFHDPATVHIHVHIHSILDRLHRCSTCRIFFSLCILELALSRTLIEKERHVALSAGAVACGLQSARCAFLRGTCVHCEHCQLLELHPFRLFYPHNTLCTTFFSPSRAKPMLVRPLLVPIFLSRSTVWKPFQI